MCGRYALSLRPSAMRQRLEDQDMPTEEAPPDDDPQLRQSYNFAPGYHGLIYRAATNDRGTDATPFEDDCQPSPKRAKISHTAQDPPSSQTAPEVDGLATRETKYKLQSAKWGLIPFWTKRPPDFGSMLRTINCRDDSLAAPTGMWTTMKQRKRCVVVAEGFYEWLKKNNGKDRLPHFIKRKDGGVMCMAGLWDCVKYETREQDDEKGDAGDDKLYTYTIITTDSNQQLNFLHDRMPVILEPGSEEMRKWLDPNNIGWNKELQDMLRPFNGELEIYPVDKAVGKVGNNSPNFVIPINSRENKKNIANFFGAQKAGQSPSKYMNLQTAVKKDPDEHRETAEHVEDPESNAPLPKPASKSDSELSQAIRQDLLSTSSSDLVKAEDEVTERKIKHEQDELGDDDLLEAEKSPPRKVFRSTPAAKAQRTSKPDIKQENDGVGDEDLLEAEKSPPRRTFGTPSKPKSTAVKSPETKHASAVPSTPSKTRSATSNAGVARTPGKGTGGAEGNKKITAFFGGK